MRFMLFMIPKGYQGADVDPNLTPPADLVEKKMKFNEEMAAAGILIGLDGLTPPTKAVQVKFGPGGPAIADGPFAESKEVIGGYWIINVASRDAAIDWASRVPALDGDVIEVRQIFEMADFPDDVKAAAVGDAVRAAIG